MSIKRRQKTLKYIFNPDERDYWKNVHVNIDAISEKWKDFYLDTTKKTLEKIPSSDLQTILDTYYVNGQKKYTLNSFLEDTKKAIDLRCVIEFSLSNPKLLSQYFGIPILSGSVNKVEVLKNVLKVHKAKKIQILFLQILKQKFGKGNFNFNFDDDLSDESPQLYENAFSLLARFLKRENKENKVFHFRESYFSNGEWIFLLLKETGDVIYPAIPDNTRVLKGDYLIVTINTSTKNLEINTKSTKEAYLIKDYLSRKLQNNLRYVKTTAAYTPDEFFNKIKLENNKNEFSLVDVEFKESNINSKIKISDTVNKNDIFSQINTLKDKGIIKLKDFSEFKALSFYFKGISLKINVEENKWGQIRLNLVDRSKPKAEVSQFKEKFEKEFSINLNSYLENSNQALNTKKIVQNLLNKSTIEANIPKEVEQVLLDLISLKILNKPTNSAKRKCEKCGKFTWIKGDCPSCGNLLLIEGDYIDLKENTKGVYNFVAKTLSNSKAFVVKKTTKQIQSSKFSLIDIIDDEGNPLSIYISTSNVPEKITHHFHERGLPLLVILIKFKDALSKDIQDNDFECLDISDIYSEHQNPASILKLFKTLAQSQKHKWQKKISDKGYKSYSSLCDKRFGYHDQDFENDIFNLLHELFLVGDRLGGNFAGVPAPDGVVSIQNYKNPIKRYCLAWDCKFSTQSKGYQLTDQPAKHRHYINSLKKNDKIMLYGGLQTYAIISQNMDMKKFETFYKQMITRFRWKGNVLFVEEKIVLEIYRIYKDNEEVIRNHPEIFYTDLFNLFKTIWKKDSEKFKLLSDSRMKTFITNIQNAFQKKAINFKFSRNEFY